MDLDSLAVKAKTSERHLLLLIKATKKYRYIYVRKFPKETRILTDIDGDLVTLVWELARRYDPNRCVSFKTFLLTSMQKKLALSYKYYQYRKNTIRSRSKNQRDFEQATKDVTSKDMPIYMFTDLRDVLEKTFCGAEKIIFAGIISKRGESVVKMAKQNGISIRRVYIAKKNIYGLAKAMVYWDGELLNIYRLSVMLRGLVEDVIKEMQYV